jgi:hypothetical protein
MLSNVADKYRVTSLSLAALVEEFNPIIRDPVLCDKIIRGDVKHTHTACLRLNESHCIYRQCIVGDMLVRRNLPYIQAPAHFKG